MPTSSSHLWACFFCCPGKGRPSEPEADDGNTGRMQPVPEKSMNEASSIHETLQDKVLLQHSAPSPDSLEQMYGLQDEEWTRPQTPPPQTPSLMNPDLEVLYEKRIQDLEDELNLVLRRNKELSTKVSELEDAMFPEVERTSWAENQPGHQIKGHLAKSMKERREQEHRALKAEENLRDLKHQNAVLLKRLHQAGWKSPGHVALHPVAPPLGTIGPMFSVLRNATLKMAPPVPHESTETPGPLQENGTREAGESNHSPSAMHEVLEKIRSGVPLRPVTPPQKSGITLVATRQPDSANGGARCCLNGILVDERVETPVMLGELSTSAKPLGSLRALPSETPEMRSPGKEALAGLCNLEQPENPFAERNSRASPGSGRSTDDEGSTSSTLPVTSNHSTDNEDQDPATGSFKSISVTEMVSSVTKRPIPAPEALGMVDLAQDSQSNNDWMGSHRQSASEDHTHPEIVAGNEAFVGESCAAELRMSPKVFQPMVGFSELSSEALVGNPEQKFSFDLTNCMCQGVPGFSLHPCSEKRTGEILDSGIKDGGCLKAHIDAADTLVMETVGISVDVNILDLVQGSFLNVVVTETLAPQYDSTQENLLEMAAMVQEDRVDCNDIVSSLDGGLTTHNSDGIGPNLCEGSLEPSSDPTFEGSSLPERLQMLPVGLPGHEEDLLEKIGQSVVPLSQGVDLNVSEDSFPSGPDTISEQLQCDLAPHNAECFPSEDVPCSDAPELLVDSEYF
ncbi:uncharacterized protein [Ambystoma mexicanum]|uniref:uncharacterized protein isoform X1 n=1 Tax=Ambystoma mexicanum TaxID=8296 RepID=UPI0037E9AFBA